MKRRTPPRARAAVLGRPEHGSTFLALYRYALLAPLVSGNSSVMLRGFVGQVWDLIRRTAAQWNRHRSSEMASSLAFYGAVAIAGLGLVALYAAARIAGAALHMRKHVDKPDTLRERTTRKSSIRFCGWRHRGMMRGSRWSSGWYCFLRR